VPPRPAAAAGPALTVAAQRRWPLSRCRARPRSVHSGQVGTCSSRPGADMTAARKAIDRSSISRSRTGNSESFPHRVSITVLRHRTRFPLPTRRTRGTGRAPWITRCPAQIGRASEGNGIARRRQARTR
jgi:hypothetical protein